MPAHQLRADVGPCPTFRMILSIVQARPAPEPPVWLSAEPVSLISLEGGSTWLGSSTAASRYEGGSLTVVAESDARAAGGAAARDVAIAYGHFGHACVGRLAGRFRFLLYDSKSRELFAASSTAPSWPLAYWSDSRTTVVGSRLLSLIRCPEVPRSLNENYLVHLVMGLSAMAGGTTALQGIRRLCPGEALIVGIHGPRVSRVDSLAPRHVRETGWRVGELFLEELAAALPDAAQVGPTAVSFSGGLDSAALAVAGLRHADVLPAYSFVAPGLGTHAEIGALDTMERALPGLSLSRFDASGTIDFPDLGPVLRDDPPLVPLALLPARMQLWARVHEAGLRVLIEGEGGDELFSMLPTPVDSLRRGHFIDVARHVLASGERRNLVKHGLLFPMLPRVMCRAWTALREPMESHLPAFATWDARQHPLVQEATDEFHASLVHRPFEQHLQQWLSAPVVVGGALSRRHLAACFGLELAWPMLERNVLELVLGLHQRRLLRAGPQKTFLQDALKGIVPEEVRLLPKEIGLYRAFIPRVLTSPRSREALGDARVRARLADLVRFERIEAMLDGLAAGRQLELGALWHLECVVSFAEWYARASREYGVV